ncbi:MAG: biopolymer transporter ExbD [Myxococcales bacterium]|nr:biopolymer transporter ExbD [Myxococcales bacterium]|tara:strand:- start:748 stop:1173 length:426 start_codon:yes stop_codon:yes gene_type:complete
MAALNFEEDEVISEINIVPFVDIVLVLLIIVMVTSTALVKASFEVKLPKAASAGQTVESTLNIVMTRDGQLFLNGEETTKADVVGYIRVELPKSPKMQAVISADQDVDYGKVVKLIDLVKKNGIESFALNIEREEQPKIGL